MHKSVGNLNQNTFYLISPGVLVVSLAAVYKTQPHADTAT